MRLTNRQMAETDLEFRKACEIAGQFPSRRRYIRYKHGRGLAFLLTQPNAKAIDNYSQNGINIPTK